MQRSGGRVREVVRAFPAAPLSAQQIVQPIAEPGVGALQFPYPRARGFDHAFGEADERILGFRRGDMLPREPPGVLALVDHFVDGSIKLRRRDGRRLGDRARERQQQSGCQQRGGADGPAELGLEILAGLQRLRIEAAQHVDRFHDRIDT